MPQQVTGYTLNGYTLRKNRAICLGSFATVEEAKAYTQALVSYPLAWIDGTKASDRDWFAAQTGDDYWLGMHGGHEKMIAHEKQSYLQFYSTHASSEGDTLMEELGHDAWWDRYHIEPDLTPQVAAIDGAEYIDATDHAGWYVKPFGGRLWAVYNDRRGSGSRLFIELADTRAQALALAWKLRTEEECLHKKLLVAADRRARRRGFFAALFRRRVRQRTT